MKPQGARILMVNFYVYLYRVNQAESKWPEPERVVRAICCKLKRITAAEAVSKSTCFLNC